MALFSRPTVLPLAPRVTFFFSAVVGSAKDAESRIDFSWELPGGGHGGARLVVARVVAERIRQALTSNIAAYEKRFGHIPQAPPRTDPPPDIHSSQEFTANAMRVSHTDSEFLLDFTLSIGGVAQPFDRVVAVTLPPYVHRVVAALDAALEQSA